MDTFKIREKLGGRDGLNNPCTLQRRMLELCSEVETLRDKLSIAEVSVADMKRLHQGEGDYPKLLSHYGKHGDRHIVIVNEWREGDAWLAMFNAMDQWDQFYDESLMEEDEKHWYDRAKKGEWHYAYYLLDFRRDYEYERVEITCIDTPYSLRKQLHGT